MHRITYHQQTVSVFFAAHCLMVDVFVLTVGHVDFSPEVTAALRLTDGALVVVDCVEGVRVQTSTVLRQAIAERIKPVLFLNKLDRIFLELNEDPEDAYQTLARTIESVNVIVATYHDELLGDVTVYPQAGTVGFGSGLHGWGFTLYDFAKLHHARHNMPIKKLMKRLWGDHFYDPEKKKWYNAETKGDRKLDRGFVALVLKPIRKIFQAVNNKHLQTIEAVLQELNLVNEVRVRDDKGAALDIDPKALGREIMQRWLPASDALLRLITEYLPSPKQAQRYRLGNLYEGPPDDAAANAVRSCDSNGELMLFVSKMVPTADCSRFFALGRVFSGTVRAGQMVRFQGPEYVPGSKHDLHVGRIQKCVVMMGPYQENIAECPAGNIVGLVGVDNYLMKCGTITTIEDAHSFVPMRYSVAPIVRVAVKPVNPAQTPKLLVGLRRLARSDPLVQCFLSAEGENVIAGCGELHLEVCVKDLRELYLEGCEIKVTDPIVPFRESVSSKSSLQCLAKSANGLNRAMMTAEPVGELLSAAIEDRTVNVDPRTQEDAKARARSLAIEYKWDAEDSRRIMGFGSSPDSLANILVDTSKAVAYLNEVKDSVIAAFEQVTIGGVLMNEPLRAVRFNLEDMSLHSDNAHRGSGQIIPCARNAMYAAQIAAQPRVQEPVYKCEITGPRSLLGGVFDTLRRRRAVTRAVNDSPVSGSDLCTVEAFLPVMESFGFASELRRNTGGEAFAQLLFSHWQEVEGDPYDPNSLAHSIASNVRARKGMKPQLPVLSDYHCKL